MGRFYHEGAFVVSQVKYGSLKGRMMDSPDILARPDKSQAPWVLGWDSDVFTESHTTMQKIKCISKCH